MLDLIVMTLRSLLTGCRGQAALQAENIALRHQLTVLQRTQKRLVLNAVDRCLWVWLSRLWSAWRSALLSRNHARYNASAESLHFRKSAVCTIATNASHNSTFRCGTRVCLFSLELEVYRAISDSTAF